MKKVVIEKDDSVVSIDEIDPTQKTYVGIAYYDGTLSDFYKLHEIGEIGDQNWAFVSLSDSVCYACGTSKLAKDAIKDFFTTVGENSVYEVSNIEDLIKCLQEN